MQTAIDALIKALFHDDVAERHQARRALVALGAQTVEPLARLISNPDVDVRWEAVKALADIQSPTAADDLVRALADKDSGIRWIAAEGLIALERQGLIPLLQALRKNPDSDFLWDATHHVLRKLARGKLKDQIAPAFAALNKSCSKEELLTMTNTTLTRLKKP